MSARTPDDATQAFTTRPAPGGAAPLMSGRAPDDAAPAFTISIISHGQGRYCAQLLADLAQHSAGALARVVLTLNIPEELRPDPQLPFPVQVLRNEQPRGFGANHNQAFRHCQTPLFAVLNPDLRLAVDPFPALARWLADPATGIVAPVVREPDGSVADFVRPLVTPWEVLRRRIGRTPAQPDAPPDWIAGMFLAFRRETYAELGGFDERYFLYCEDVDICARARLHGLALRIAAEATVTHQAQRASRRSWTRMRMHVASLLRLWSSPAYRAYRKLLRS
jgi:GT2 family glycosyltransferase